MTSFNERKAQNLIHSFYCFFYVTRRFYPRCVLSPQLFPVVNQTGATKSWNTVSNTAESDDNNGKRISRRVWTRTWFPHSNTLCPSPTPTPQEGNRCTVVPFVIRSDHESSWLLSLISLQTFSPRITSHTVKAMHCNVI